ncbi:MAG: hypothetical protein LBS37_09760 [Treponema sp.]|jgi:hypothetical protein|nr:hypothetical protein [Treponema sp.]
MKKRVVFLVLVCISAALSAQSIKVGGGGNFTANFDTFAPTEDGKEFFKDRNTHMLGGGIYAFFDLTYLEFNAGVLFGNFNWDNTDDLSDEEKKGVNITALKLGLFGKFPIAMGAFTLFPMLGIDGQMFINGKYMDEDIEAEDGRKMWNQFWFKAGVGLDIPLPAGGGKVFLRPEFLYGIRMNTDDEKDVLDEVKDADPKVLNAIIGHGLDLKLAIGYSF